MKTTRRRFVRSLATAIGAPMIIPASVLGRDGGVAPSNRLVLGGIGLGPRGREDLRAFLGFPDVQFVMNADVQATRRDVIRVMVNRHYQNNDCLVTSDMHEVLGRKDIDAVIIATGDRWHAPASILAAKAGKDIYCEKPCSMTIQETQELADAVKQHKRVFQAGTQRRNVDNFRFAAELARSGRLGRLRTVHAGITEIKESHEQLPEQTTPPAHTVDWDRWLGPAPWRPYNSDYVNGRWRWYFDFHAGAGLPEWGAHTVDLCQWAANADATTPIEFEAAGQSVHGVYANGIKLVMRRAARGEGNWVVPGTCPVRFEGDEGWIEAADSGKVVASSDSLLTGLPSAEMYGTDPTKHIREFLDCVKSRRQPASNADVTRSGHIACHAAAIAWRLGRKVKFDPLTGKFPDDPEANRQRSRDRRAPWGRV